MTITIAFINNHFPAGWMQLPMDLQHCLPFTFRHTRLDINLKASFDPGRGQYHSPSILQKVLDNIPDDSDKIVGITQVDLFIPVLTFVFGEAQLSGPAALVSTHRLHNTFYGLPENDNLLYERLLKEVLHELGHTMGLVHCRDYRCVMHASTYVEDSDIKQARFCKECQGKLGVTCEE